MSVYPPTKRATFSTTIDHFTYTSNSTFDLRYFAFEKFAEGRETAPVLFYCGNEGEIESFYNASGGMFEMAKALGAHVMLVEHRYYGKSLPFGPKRSFDPLAMKYLTIEQALADYSEVLVALPKLLNCKGTGLNAVAGRCDVILMGGSYGGMLAAWHRVKYRHLSVGAIASGAPIDFYFNEHIQRRFEDAYTATFANHGGVAGCGEALSLLLTQLSTATNAGLIQAGVASCQPLGRNSVERYSFYARGALSSLAMVDYPYPCGFIAPLPANPVQVACKSLTQRGQQQGQGRGQADLEQPDLRGLHEAVLLMVNSSGSLPCIDLEAELVGKTPGFRRHATLQGGLVGVTAWNYQACTELLLEPITSDGFGFLPESREQLTEVRANCAARFVVLPPLLPYMDT